MQIFKEIRTESLSKAELLCYYRSYLMIIEREKTSDLVLSVTDLNVFSQAFNALVDKSFVPFCKINLEKDSQQITPEIAEMLVYYSDYHKSIFIDVVLLSSVLFGSSQELFKAQNVKFYNNILSILISIAGSVNLPLLKRLVPLVKSLLCYDAYVLRAGMFLAVFGMVSLPSGSTVDIKILAALNHPSFENVLNNGSFIDSERETAILYYIHHNPFYATFVKDDLLSILQRGDTNTSLFLDYLERSDPSSSFPFSFISENISIFYALIDMHKQIIPIFISSLKQRTILPCMVIPYIMSSSECDYLYRMHLETALNSIPDALYIITRRIKLALNNRSIEIKEEPTTFSTAEQSSIEDELHPKFISKNDLKSIIDYELRTNFIENICRVVGPRKVARKMPAMPGVLMVFVILRQLRNLDKKSKAIFYNVLEDNAQDEQVMDLIGLSREFYKHMNKGILPVEYMLKLVDEKEQNN